MRERRYESFINIRTRVCCIGGKPVPCNKFPQSPLSLSFCIHLFSLRCPPRERFVCLLVACLTSQQQASVSQGRICSDNFTCCHTEIEVADPTVYLTQSQYTDTGPTSPSADPITPGAWKGSHWSANFEVTGMSRPRKKSRLQRDSNPGPSALEADALTTRPTKRSRERKIPGSNPICDGIFPGRVIPVTSKLALQWLPCQAPGIIGSALGLVGPVPVYSGWVR